MSKILLLNSDNIIIDIVDNIEQVENGYKVYNSGLEYIYTEELTQKYTATIPDDAVPLKYKYVDNKFVLNPGYVEPIVGAEVTKEELQQKINDLINQANELQQQLEAIS